jgi:hypothetical protein
MQILVKCVIYSCARGIFGSAYENILKRNVRNSAKRKKKFCIFIGENKSERERFWNKLYDAKNKRIFYANIFG